MQLITSLVLPQWAVVEKFKYQVIEVQYSSWDNILFNVFYAVP